MSKKYLVQIIPEDGTNIKNISVTRFKLKFVIALGIFFVLLFLGFITFFGSFVYLFDKNIENKKIITNIKIDKSKIFEIEKNLYKMELFSQKLKKFANSSDIDHIDIEGILNEDDSKNINVQDIDYKYIPNIVPVAGWITAKYNKKYHPGIDIAADFGTPYVASASGKVYYIGESDVFGKYIILKHKKGFMTKYSHSSKIVVEEGETVEKGQLIGFIGKTGSTSGSHLHYEILKDGKNIDPIKFINNFYKIKIEE